MTKIFIRPSKDRNFCLQLFSVLFFLMLYTLGIGSAISLVGAVITVYCDQFPSHPRWIVTLVVCIGGFLIGLVYICPVSWLN